MERKLVLVKPETTESASGPAGRLPDVLPNDEGIRPAGPSDECFYCHRKVGTPHGAKCSVVLKRVMLRVEALGGYRGEWEKEVPFHWDPELCVFHVMESSWCQGNLDPMNVAWNVADAEAAIAAARVYAGAREGCLCGFYTFTFDRVTEPGPYLLKG